LPNEKFSVIWGGVLGQGRENCVVWDEYSVG
jgi:hypothetical protein